MRTERKVTKLETVVNVVCDICGKGEISGIPCRRCEICGRDICFHHQIEDPRVMDWGDYPDYICTECYVIGKPYMEKIREEEKRSEGVIDKLEKQWEEAALGNAQKG